MMLNTCQDGSCFRRSELIVLVPPELKISVKETTRPGISSRPINTLYALPLEVPR
ncbi:hypothetical protein D3C80_1034600 [compost metagenome]